MRFIIFAILLTMIGPLQAQNAQGSGDIGAWRSVHYASFGIWEAACDARDVSGEVETRCYVRVIDPVSFRPNYNALTLFIANGAAGEEIELGLPENTEFPKDGITIRDGAGQIWSLDDGRCETVDLCAFTNAEVDAFLTAFSSGDEVVFTYTNTSGAAEIRRWSLIDGRAAFMNMRQVASEKK